MDIAITKMSSKGQVVIPVEMRKGLADGEKLVIIRNKDQIIMKRAVELESNFSEDIEFAKRTEAAFKRIKEGKGVKMDFDEFLEEMKEW